MGTRRGQAVSAEPTLLTQWTGVLIGDAQARTKPIDELGHMLPVLIMDVRLDNPTHNHLRVEQPFAAADMHQCQAAARRFRKGTRVTVQAPIAHVHIKAENTAHIHIHQPEETTV